MAKSQTRTPKPEPKRDWHLELGIWDVGFRTRQRALRDVSSCLKVSSIRRSLSSFDTLRCSSLEAMPPRCRRLPGGSAEARAPFRARSAARRSITMPAASARAFCFISSRNRSASERVRETICFGLAARLRQEFAATRRGAAPAPALPSAHRRATCGSSPAGCSSASSSGRQANFASSRHEDQERDDGPDVKPGIGLDQRIVHGERPLSTEGRLYFSRTMSSANTSARIATPSSRKSGRFTAPVICAVALGCRADRLRRAPPQAGRCQDPRR